MPPRSRRHNVMPAARVAALWGGAAIAAVGGAGTPSCAQDAPPPATPVPATIPVPAPSPAPQTPAQTNAPAIPPPLPPVPQATPTGAGPDVSPLTPALNLDAPPPRQDIPIVLEGPLDPSGAETLSQDERGFLMVDHADTLDATDADQIVVLDGNVRMRYNGYLIFADHATYDTRNKIATLQSNVVVNTGRQLIYADYMRLDVRTRQFTSREGRSVVPPSLVGPNLLQPLRISGDTFGREGRNLVATGGFLTTCDFPFPHYRIGFRKATIIPNNRIVLRDATFYQYDRRILKIPYLAIPIRDQIRYSYLPQVGRTQEEGYFIKSAIGYALGALYPGIFRLDLMEKKGVGVGFDQAYQFASLAASGSLALYSLRDKNRGVNNLNGRLNHQQRIGTVDTSINSDFQNNSYNSISADSRTAQTTLTATRLIKASSTSVSYSFGTSDFSNSVSNTRAYSISQTQRLARLFSIRAGLTGNENSNSNFDTLTNTTSGTSTIQQVGDVRATGQIGIFDVDLNANKNLAARQTGTFGGGSFFSGTERLPDITVATDSRRLFGNDRIPLRLALGFGRYIENPNKVQTQRSLFNLDANPRPIALTRSGLSLTLAGGLRQTFYSSDNAQYVLTNASSLQQRIGGSGALRLTYGYLRPYGSTPSTFRLDDVGAFNNLGANLDINGPRVRFSLITGYDIQRAQSDLSPGIPKNPWQNAAIQIALRPSAVFQTRFTGAYDINSGRLIDLTNRVRVRTAYGFALDTGIRFDPQQKKFAQITEVLETPLFGRGLSLVALTGYNGFTKRFEYKSLGLTRHLHDYEIVLSYIDQPYGFRTEKGFNLSFRLRALPSPVRSNTGQYGAALDTGTGEIF